ncbi:MAG: hypothetical protein HY335_06395 [Deinococcus sp.]|nr:hypothetical protein [Deinococcus sp.]
MAGAKAAPRPLGKWWARWRAVWNRHALPVLRCSLCQRPQAVAGRLLEGCGQFLCADCVTVYLAVTTAVAAAGCAFCCKPANLVRRLVGTPQLAICNECLARARAILYPPPKPVEPPDPLLPPRGPKRPGPRF